jgi:hypothetical protein
MAGLDPAIHVFSEDGPKTWMPATSAGMTVDDCDRVARLLEPLADRRFGDGFAQRGHADVGHGFNPCGVNSCSVMPALVAGIHVLAAVQQARRGRLG